MFSSPSQHPTVLRLAIGCGMALTLAAFGCGDDTGGANGTGGGSSSAGGDEGGASSAGGGGSGPTASSTGSTQSASSAGGADAGSGGAPAEACDPLDAGCVVCGDASCGDGDECCSGAAPACGDPASCDAVNQGCDGAEDCAGSTCCVFLNAPDGVPQYGSTTCDATCDQYFDGQLISGHSCRTSTDCASAGQDHRNCCRASGVDVGICIDDDGAAALEAADGSCD